MSGSPILPPIPNRQESVTRMTGQSHWRVMSFVFLIALSAIAAATVSDYGVTWDEDYYREYGFLLQNWYTSLGANQEALTKWRLYHYGGFFDIIAQLATSLLPYGVYETRHAVSLIFGLLGVAATYGIGYQLAGVRGGLFAALFLVLTPVYYGHMFSNAKDIPFAALFALSLFLILRSASYLPRVPRRLILKLGIATGLAMAVRVPGAVLLGYAALLWLGCLLAQRWRNPAAERDELLRSAQSVSLRFLAMAAIAWSTMVALWPYAQVSPILNPLRALRENLAYDWPLTVLFEGRFIKASELPPNYLPTWFAISLPEFYFAAFLIGGAMSAVFLWRLARGRANPIPLLQVGLLALVICVPILAHVVLRSTVYDGLRQFLFVLPAMAALAGAAVAGFLRSRVSQAPRLAALAVVLGSVGVTIYDMVELHPYQYVYFNRLVAGGLESASARFETDYYGASYREGVRWLIRNYRPQSGERVRVANPSREFLTEYYLTSSKELRDRFQHVKAWDRPHVYLSITRWNWHKEKQGKLLYVVKRKGVPLLYVIELAPPGGPEPAKGAG